MADINEVWGDDYDSDEEEMAISEFYNLSNRTTAAAEAARRKNRRELGTANRPLPVTADNYRRREPRVSSVPAAAYAPVNYVSETSMHSPMFYNDHTHVKRILSHLSECRHCKLSLINLLRDSSVEPVPSLSSGGTKEHFNQGILSRIIGDTQLLVVIILVLIVYILRR
jgi:hypothetical protein